MTPFVFIAAYIYFWGTLATQAEAALKLSHAPFAELMYLVVIL
jgi:hypothetical protein